MGWDFIKIKASFRETWIISKLQRTRFVLGKTLFGMSSVSSQNRRKAWTFIFIPLVFIPCKLSHIYCRVGNLENFVSKVSQFELIKIGLCADRIFQEIKSLFYNKDGCRKHFIYDLWSVSTFLFYFFFFFSLKYAPIFKTRYICSSFSSPQFRMYHHFYHVYLID